MYFEGYLLKSFQQHTTLTDTNIWKKRKKPLYEWNPNRQICKYLSQVKHYARSCEENEDGKDMTLILK